MPADALAVGRGPAVRCVGTEPPPRRSDGTEDDRLSGESPKNSMQTTGTSVMRSTKGKDMEDDGEGGLFVRTEGGFMLPVVRIACVGVCETALRRVDQLRRQGLRTAVLCATRLRLIPAAVFGPWHVVDGFGIGTGDPAWWHPDDDPEVDAGAVCRWSLAYGPVMAQTDDGRWTLSDAVPATVLVTGCLNDAWDAARWPLTAADGTTVFDQQHPPFTVDECSPEHLALARGAWDQPCTIRVRRCANPSASCRLARRPVVDFLVPSRHRHEFGGGLVMVAR